MDAEKNSKEQVLLYALIAALVLAVVFAIVMLFRNVSIKNDLKVLEEEKEMQRIDFQYEVDSLMKVHNKLKESYGELSQELAQKDSIIQADAVEIKKLLDSQWDYYRIKKKVAALQEISQNYVRQMDSLYRVNQELEAENERIREEYQAERRQNNTLTRQKEELTNKVNLATVLRIYNLTADAVRFKGGSHETETDKAGRTERIRVMFTIGQNDLVDAGPKTFYLRIADPTKQIITKGMGDEYAFTYQGELLQYTEKVTVNYENKEKDVRAYYIKPSGKNMQPGYYFVDIYDDNDNLIGQTSFDLR